MNDRNPVQKGATTDDSGGVEPTENATFEAGPEPRELAEDDYSAESQLSTRRRDFLKCAASGVAVGGLAGCSSSPLGGGGYDVFDEISVAIASGGRYERYAYPVYTLDVDDWSEYGGRADDISLDPHHYPGGMEMKEGERGPGVLAPNDDWADTWSPGVHLETNHVPIAYTEKMRGRDGTVSVVVHKYNITAEGCYEYESVYRGTLEELGFSEHPRHSQVYLGAIDVTELVGPDRDGFNVFWLGGSEITLRSAEVESAPSC